LNNPPKLSIMAQIPTQLDLKSLCDVSKYVAEFATPCLDESSNLHADEMLLLDDLKHKIELCSKDNAKFTSNNCLRAPLHHNWRKRCPHYDSEMPETLGDAIDMDDGSEDCLQPVLLFCSAQPRRMLRD